MRTFNYREIPPKLLGTGFHDALAKLYEDRGKLGMLKQLQPEALDGMRARARMENTDASLHIDGLYQVALSSHDDARACKIAEDTTDDFIVVAVNDHTV